MENNKFASAIEGNVGPTRVKRVEPPPASYGKEVCEPKVSLVSTWASSRTPEYSYQCISCPVSKPGFDPVV